MALSVFAHDKKEDCMEALLQGRVAEYGPILRAPNENNSKCREGYIFTMDTKREYCVFALEISLENMCMATC